MDGAEYIAAYDFKRSVLYYINPTVAKWFVEHQSGSAISVFLTGVVVTIISMSLCIPFIYLFNKYVPQLSGKPKVNGPWIRNLI